MGALLKFIVDHNVGKLARWLRLMGYDAVFFNRGTDSEMVAQALSKGRIILTRDTHIMERRVVSEGTIKAVLITSDKHEKQIRQVITTLELDYRLALFSRCLECNQALEERSHEQVRNRVPPYVFKTQEQYRECPACHRIYWRGTHWQAMTEKLQQLAAQNEAS